MPDDLREQVASLMHVGVASFDDARAKVEAGVGGIFITSWADPAMLTQPGRDIHELKRIAGRPLMVSIDFEGGRVQRHSQILGSFPAPGALAAQGESGVQETASAIGRSLSAHGITVDFAPVLDVDGAGLHVVGDRSFSADPQTAGALGAAFARGLMEAGVRPVYKHFPGHGRASGDTHAGGAVTPALPEIKEHDLASFAQALERTPHASVMLGHMIVPGLGDSLPSSLNPAAYRLLRYGDYPGGRGYRGLTFTDDLTGMRAITDKYPLDQAVSQAIAAGADQALWSNGTDPNGVIDAVVQRVRNQEIPQERITAAVFRVARAHSL
ncbi:glycoside hydrolase family 3 N-terminal domain-containing protein [Corynebacterium tapiri]